MSEASAGNRRLLATGLKLVIAALLLWGVSRTIRAGINDLGEARWHFSPAWFGLATVSYLAGLAPCAWFWRQVLARLGVKRRGLTIWRAYFIGHLGKYVPGKALVVVIRTALVNPVRDETSAVAAAVFFETLTMMAVGGLMAGGLLAIVVRDQPWLVALALGLMVASAAPTIPAIFLRIVRFVERVLGRTSGYTALGALDAGLVLRGWVAIACGWVMIGVSLWATARGLGAVGEGAGHELPLCVATSGLAVVAGFLSMIPGGVVVRESIMLELLEPAYGAAMALLTAVAARLVWLVAELAISTILYFSGGASDSGAA